ncbi:hypothetical protein GT204_07065 [Streptomyces sp. SID4919]|uniref:hypothetical protein n=1 Tax=unclassified Streptomyces TaxID=2593676 RepID=UPI000C0742C5|nr:MULTISPECIES: hypothetical protein [unclassified Streptomyces]MYY08668.1 hypothetical protein [Streptomyces sp. SID4919]
MRGAARADRLDRAAQGAGRRLDRTAALHANAETALRAERARYAAEPGRHSTDGPRLLCAAAVVVHTPHPPPPLA